MKYLIPLLTTLSLTPGCRDKCLDQVYDSTLQVIREFNCGRCQSVLNGDQRKLDCPSGTLSGEVNSRVFNLEIDCGSVQLQLENESAALVCGHDLELITSAPYIRDQFEVILSQLEVD